MSRFDETLPFDELDPCCQKEIEIERKVSAVKSQLRTHDRSNIRFDLTRSVMQPLPTKYVPYHAYE